MPHTPGPWTTVDAEWLMSQRTGMGFRYFPVRATDQTWDIATVFADEDDSEMIANVRLIAAAPQMLAALKRMREVFEQLADGDWRMLDATYVDQLIESDGLHGCDQAIAKAEERE